MAQGWVSCCIVVLFSQTSNFHIVQLALFTGTNGLLVSYCWGIPAIGVYMYLLLVASWSSTETRVIFGCVGHLHGLDVQLYLLPLEPVSILNCPL